MSFIAENTVLEPTFPVYSRLSYPREGSFRVALPTGKNIPKNLLRPIEQAILPENAYDNDDGRCSSKGSLKISRSGVQGLYTDTLAVLESGFRGNTKASMARATTDDLLSKPGSTNTRSYSSFLRLTYSSHPVSIKGQLSCFGFGFSGKTEINLNLPAGWSFVEVLIPNGSNTTDPTRFQNAPAVKLENWRLEKQP